MNKKPAQLTLEEERAREKAIDFYRYIGKTDVEATRLAWQDVQKAFPRLREYDIEQSGCMTSGRSVHKSTSFPAECSRAHETLKRESDSE